MLLSKLNPLRVKRKVMRILQSKKIKQKNQHINQLWWNEEYIINQLSQLVRGREGEGDYTINPEVKEMEHQKGRFLNMSKIKDEIELADYEGDILEFGTWQGLSLILLSMLFSQGHHRRMAIGIDSFEGLPISSTIWEKGGFNNTSIDVAQNNLKKFARLFENRIDTKLIKGWFDDPKVQQELRNLALDPILVHFDADLGVSTSQALTIVEPFLQDRQKPVYFLFDDWGCHPDEVPDAFFNWLEKFRLGKQVHITKLSSTRFTRYYRLNFSGVKNDY